MASYLQRETAKQARQDINLFIEFTMRIKQSRCHVAIQNHLRNNKRAGIIAHKDLGKTTQTLLYTLHRLGNNPSLLQRLVCSDDEPAKERVMFLRDMITRNKRLKLVFPWLKKSKKYDDWGKYSLTVERDRFAKDSSISAHGILTQVEGGRADEIMFDDVCDFSNTIRYPKKRDLIKQAVKTVFIPLLDPQHGKASWIATRHHPDDATEWMYKNKAWKWIDFSVTGDPPESPWPERWTTELLVERQNEIGSLEFDRAYRNVLHSDDERIIKEEWASLRYSNRPRGDLRLTAWDFGTGVSAKSDYTAMVVADIDYKEKRVFVVFCKRWRDLTYNGIIREILRAQKEWAPNNQIIENAAFQAIIGRDEELAGVPVVKATPKIKKEERVRNTAVWYEQKRVIFRDGFCEDLVSELLAFPKSTNDDFVDALTHLLLYAIEKFGRSFRPGDSASGGMTRVFTRRSMGETMPRSQHSQSRRQRGPGFKKARW